MSGRGGSKPERAVQWFVVAVLAAVALAYFGMPARSQDQPGWSAELWATEGGEELVAAVRSFEPEAEAFAPTLAVMCGLTLRYDPGQEADGSVDWTGQTADVTFDFGGSVIERELQYEAMDGMFSVRLTADDPLVEAIRGGSQVEVRAEGLPVNGFSLAGSTAAIAEMRRNC